MRHVSDTDPGWINRKFKEQRALGGQRASVRTIVSGTQTQFKTDTFTLIAAGAQDLALTYLPRDGSVHVKWHPGAGAGIDQLENTDWTRTGATITLSATEPAIGDLFTIAYAHHGETPTPNPEPEPDPPTPAAPYDETMLALGPLAYYRMGDASGTTMTDSSGNGRNGEYSNSPTLGTTGLLAGDADTCVTFNGTNQSAHVIDGGWEGVSTITVAAIIKPSAIGAEMCVVSRDNNSFTGASGRYYRLDVQANGRATFTCWCTDGVDTATTAFSTTTLVTGSTYRLVGTYDGSTVRLYVNGVEEDNVAQSGALPDRSAIAYTYIGRREIGSQFFAGDIDEVAIISGAITAADVTDLEESAT